MIATKSQKTSLSCPFWFSNTEHVMIPIGTVPLKLNVVHLKMSFMIRQEEDSLFYIRETKLENLRGL